MRAGITAILLSLAAPVAAGDLALGLPIDCTLGQDCHIQQFVDRDPGPGVLDYRCSDLSYDGHKGTDFALHTLADMARGVPVLASAPGLVIGLRDGMNDDGYSEDTAAQIEGRECGNGVRLRHADGYETQYCHLRSGSVAVARGDVVERGTVLGLVGQSGKAQFPHVHIGVHKDGKVIDPFASETATGCPEVHADLWATTPPYAPTGVLTTGFADRVPAYEDIQAGTAATRTISANAPALVLFGFAYGGRAGDEMRFRIAGPGGVTITSSATLDKAQARYFRAAGRHRKAAPWPVGDYVGTLQLLRGGDLVQEISVQAVVAQP